MNNELATIPESEGILANRPFGFGQGQFWTSLDLHDPEQAINLLKIRQKGDKEAKECVNLPINIVHLLRRWGQQVDDDSGEVRMYLGTTFLTDKGDTISSGSMGLERDIESLFALGLVPPWNPPITVTFKTVPTSKGRAMLQMGFDLEDLKKRLKKKGKK